MSFQWPPHGVFAHFFRKWLQCRRSINSYIAEYLQFCSVLLHCSFTSFYDVIIPSCHCSIRLFCYNVPSRRFSIMVLSFHHIMCCPSRYVVLWCSFHSLMASKHYSVAASLRPVVLSCHCSMAVFRQVVASHLSIMVLVLSCRSIRTFRVTSFL